jgi:hypothetical protein
LRLPAVRTHQQGVLAGGVGVLRDRLIRVVAVCRRGSRQDLQDERVAAVSDEASALHKGKDGVNQLWSKYIEKTFGIVLRR